MNSEDLPTSLFKKPASDAIATPAKSNVAFSSSPAFGTPIYPIREAAPRAASKGTSTGQHAKPSVLPILLPPATLRPTAFRTMTKKHNLTLSSPALQALATFIGKYCGSGWREQGLAEVVLEEVARAWKKRGGAAIIEGASADLTEILRSLEGHMSGGRPVLERHRQDHNVSSAASTDPDSSPQIDSASIRPRGLVRDDSQASLGLSSLEVDEDLVTGEEEDPRKWLKVVNAFEQPRLAYNPAKKHFEKSTSAPSLFPDPSHQTLLFKNRYNLVHQRLLRNKMFQTSTISAGRNAMLQRSASSLTTVQQAYKLTPIANLLGRSGSQHFLLGLLSLSPTSTLAISDLTGSIALDLSRAQAIPDDGMWFAPGMMVIVDGIYEEEPSTGATIGGGGGVGGTIGGKFIGISIGGPPSERREVTVGMHGANDSDDMSAGGFGWVDFLGVGSERAWGARMRAVEQRVLKQSSSSASGAGRAGVVILGEVHLDVPVTLQALRKVLGVYAAKPIQDLPMAFVLVGSFVKYASMAGGGSGGSIEYKEYFDSMAMVLSDFPSVLQAATFVFVPGDNDPWASAFSAGASTAIPRNGIPELFTSRIKKAFASANAEADRARSSSIDGEAIWTTNPSRLSICGPSQEIVIFRDDISGRIRRSAIRFGADRRTESVEEEPAITVDQEVIAAESHVPVAKASLSADVAASRKLVKTILDQSYLSPFPLSSRPMLWDYASILMLYPLPSALILVDSEAAPFAVTYEGCHVMNPGRLVAEDRRGIARWIEYDASTRRSEQRQMQF